MCTCQKRYIFVRGGRDMHAQMAYQQRKGARMHASLIDGDDHLFSRVPESNVCIQN